MATLATTGLTDEMQTYYESVFLERGKMDLIHEQGAQKKTQGKGKGKLIKFNRYTPIAAATTPLTEGSSGSEGTIAATTVSATLAEYGYYIKISKLLSLTSIDVDAEEKVDTLGQNMGETMDTLCRDAIYTGATACLAGGKTALTDVAATDVFSAVQVKKAVRTLKLAKARRYAGGYFMGKVGPMTSADLMGDSTWINAHTYKDGSNLYDGELGKLYGVRFIETNANQKSESSTVTVYSNFIHGADAFGVYDLEGDTPKLKIVTGPDKADPLGRYDTAGWAGSYAAQVLVALWMYNWKSGATA
jgi:N4-gp56 family major capsid protein